MWKYELALQEKGLKSIAGIDEVGRGALAGPMVVASVILDLTTSFPEYSQIKDSKLLTPKKRKELSEFIKKHAIAYHIEELSNELIDSKGITTCTQIGFYNSASKLQIVPDHVLTDAFAINALPKAKQTNIIRGDQNSITIAAASIIAKVYRDEYMIELHQKYDEYKIYEFDKHKGYGTKLHTDTIFRVGICDLHRKSFEPIKTLVNSKS